MGNMSFEEFKEAIVADIKAFLPDRYENADVSIQTIMKNNDVKLDAITIKLVDNNIAPTIYLNSFYEQYQDGMSLEAIMTKLAEIQTENEMSESMDVSTIIDFESAKCKISARLVSFEDNKELLTNRPHMEIDGLAVTYCIMINDMPGQVSECQASVPITNQILDSYGISVEELHQVAMENMDTLTPASFKSMNEVMADMMLPNMIEQCDGDREQAEAMLESMMPQEDAMFVLTNEQKVNGAAVLLNAKVMEEVAEKVGKDFYILPSSIHETLIVPKTVGMELRDLEEMVVEVNETQVSPQERLSDHVYAYDLDTHELYRADHEAEHQQTKEANKSQDKTKTSVKAKLQEKQKVVDKTEKATPDKAQTKNKNAALE